MLNFKTTTKGFTLAEVLVTLAVIGVVASITIPGLMQTYQEKEIVTRLKKVYSELSQATLLINADCEGSVLNCLSDSAINASEANEDASREVMNLYKAKLSAIKDCDTDGKTEGCFANEDYKCLNGDTTSCPYAGYVLSILLKNGTGLAVKWMNTTTYSSGPFMPFLIRIDCNNQNPPNQYGRDTFVFIYNPDTKMLEPAGVNYFLIPSYYTCSLTGTGHGCAARVIREGAITY